MFVDDFPQIWLIILVSVPLLIFLYVFVFIHAMFKFEVSPTLELLEEESELYAEAEPYFAMVEASLSKDGFEVAGKYVAPNMVTGTEMLLMLLLNQHAREMALGYATFVNWGRARRLRSSFLELQTAFEEDCSVNTANQEEPYAFGQRTDLFFSQLPSIADPRELLRIHRQLVQEYAAGRRRCWKWTGEPMADLQHEIAHSFARIAQAGYSRLDAAGEHYRMTLSGTWTLCIKALWPISLMAKAKVRREEKRILDQYRIFTT